MNYIRGITISGSVIMIMYLLVRYGLQKRISNKWKQLLLKAVIFYYLIPLPFLKVFYSEIGEHLFSRQANTGSAYVTSEKMLVIEVGEKRLLNAEYKQQLLIAGVWFLIAFIVIAVKIIKYFQGKKQLLRQGVKEGDFSDYNQIELLKDQYRIRRKVKLYACKEKKIAFSIGVIRPVIFYSDDYGETEREMLFTHELMHIKRFDMLWKVLASLANIIHWFNPFAWLMKRELDQMCELLCDEQVIQRKNGAERRAYAEMLLNNTVENDQVLGWKMALSREAKSVKERMEFIVRGTKKRTKRNTLMSVLVVGLAVILNSMTVFAYEDVQHWKTEGDVGEYEEQIDTFEYAFVPDGEIGPFIEQIVYDVQFVDEEGNIYPVDEVSSVAVCVHQYVEGKIQNHNLHADGSCEILVYSAKRCTKCGSTIKGELISKGTYTVCPH